MSSDGCSKSSRCRIPTTAAAALRIRSASALVVGLLLVGIMTNVGLLLSGTPYFGQHPSYGTYGRSRVSAAHCVRW